MTEIAPSLPQSEPIPRMSRREAVVLCLGLAFLLALSKPLLPDYLVRLPEAWIPPMATWLDAFFEFIKGDMEAGRPGLIYLTRWFAEGPLEFLLNTSANLLEGKRRWPNLGPIPWPAIALPLAVLAYWLGGWRLALLAGGTFLWTALVGQWDLAMETLSVLIVAAPLAFTAGLALGIVAWRSTRFDQGIRPVLAVLQTLPFYTFLLPAVIFFKVGPTAGAVATALYAMPPMILMTTLGLRNVPSAVVEAGQMSGCTRFQMLTRVYLPSARTEILVGVNQVIMLCLAMVVLTAFIGMPGLGAKLISNMNSFKLGRSFEIGVTIVLLAITLDRMSKAWVHRQPVHFEKNTPWWQRHAMTLSILVSFLVALAVADLARMIPNVNLKDVTWGTLPQYVGGLLDEVSRRQSLSQSREIDAAIKAFLDIDAVQAVTEQIRGFLTVKVLIPFRDSLLWLPTLSLILGIMALAYALAGKREALIAGAFFGIVALTGWWDRSVITLYSVISAVALAAAIGIPLGVLAARSEVWSRRALLACDTAQTFPSHVYLIPAIMLFGINDVAVVFSILIYSMVPLLRYTVEGLRSVPAEILEAADMSGASRAQRLWTVQFPMALPTLAVGFNQAIMFAFFMVIVAAFIGTQDLGQELQRTLAGTNLGTNFVLGMCVSLMALAFDLMILKWANTRKKALGLA